MIQPSKSAQILAMLRAAEGGWVETRAILHALYGVALDAPKLPRDQSKCLHVFVCGLRRKGHAIEAHARAGYARAAHSAYRLIESSPARKDNHAAQA